MCVWLQTIWMPRIESKGSLLLQVLHNMIREGHKINTPVSINMLPRE